MFKTRFLVNGATGFESFGFCGFCFVGGEGGFGFCFLFCFCFCFFLRKSWLNNELIFTIPAEVDNPVFKA